MPARPNLLLITADQMRWDCLGCTGNPTIRTPRLDALARAGMLFRNGFTPNPICVPARAAIMTGNYSHRCTGSKNNSGRIREGQPLLTDVLRSVGYRAYAVGKLHFVPYSPPGEPRLVHGFERVDLTESGRILAQFDPVGRLAGLEDYFDYLRTVGWSGYTRAHGVGNNDVRPCPSPLPPEHCVDHWIADCTIRQIDRHCQDEPRSPFFIWMSSPKPHSPYDPPRPYDTLYDPRSLPCPAGSATDLAHRYPMIERTRHTHAQDSLSPEAVQVIRAYYYGCVTFLDAMVGRVLDHLRQTGLLEQTVVVFTADHGDLLGDFGSFFKCNHLNGSVRVPFIAAGPGVAEGRISDALVGLQDILPTFAALAGTGLALPCQGLDLTPVLRSPEGAVRDLFYAHTAESPWQSAMVTDGRWKYVYSEPNAVEEFYDQIGDPLEQHNLAVATARSECLDAWRDRLRKAATALGDDHLLDGDGFARSSVDRSAFPRLPVSGMGWRWY